MTASTTPRPVGGRGSPAIGVPGRAAEELPAGEPPFAPSVPDHVLSEYSTPALDIRAASVRGLRHRNQNEPRQDAFSVTRDPDSGIVVVIVCDGVGSLSRSHEAAEFVVQRLPVLYGADRDWAKAVGAVNIELGAFADRGLVGLDPANRDKNSMATTVVAIAVDAAGDDWRLDIARCGDSTVWRLGPDGTWFEIAPIVGTDDGPFTDSVCGLPAAEPSLHVEQTTVDDGALFVMTDGVDSPLRGATEVRAHLAEWWSAPPTVFDFGSQVGFARQSHLDDRTVVGIWPSRTESVDR